MLAEKFSPWTVLALICATSIGCPSVYANDPQAHARDNSGRQIAVVVPGLPHPTAVSAPIAAPKTNPESWTPSLDGIQGRIHDAGNSVTKRLSSISTPVHLSPEAREALEKGVFAAEGFTAAAFKRLGDFGTWLSILFHNINDVPQATPATAFAVPQISTMQMQPLDDPGKRYQLIYTNEHRLKTVIGR
jgi:hypothetical protein